MILCKDVLGIDFLTLLVMALALSMDAFAIAVARALSCKQYKQDGLYTALAFGIAQATMPLIGYYGVGVLAGDMIKASGQLVASGVLLILGIKMLWDAKDSNKEDAASASCSTGSYFFPLVMQAIATSVDALAVGIGLYASGDNIFMAVGVIGFVTFLICTVGYKLASSFSGNGGKYAQIIAGIVLILLAIKPN